MNKAKKAKIPELTSRALILAACSASCLVWSRVTLSDWIPVCSLCARISSNSLSKPVRKWLRLNLKYRLWHWNVRNAYMKCMYVRCHEGHTFAFRTIWRWQYVVFTAENECWNDHSRSKACQPFTLRWSWAFSRCRLRAFCCSCKAPSDCDRARIISLSFRKLFTCRTRFATKE